MNVRMLKAHDIEKLESFLYPHQSQCMFICSNLRAAGIEYKDAAFHGEYWGDFNNSSEQLKGVIVHYWNGNVMMFAPDSGILNGLIIHLKNNIKRPIAGVLGPNDQASFVIQDLGLAEKEYSINRCEELCELDLGKLPEQKLPSYLSVVKACDISRDLLVEWMRGYSIEALGADEGVDLQEQAEKKADGLIKNACWVLLKNHQPVSLSAFNACIERMAQIGPVWTPPEHRNQGFARSLLSFSLMKEKEKGITKAILFTDNPAAIKVYQSIGFEKIGDYRLALLREGVSL